MLTIERTRWNGTTEELQARVNAFLAARAAHAETVGIPAPREDDWIEELARSGEPFQVEALPPEPDPPTTEELRAAAWDRIKAERDRRLQQGGYAAAGKWFHSDTFSRSQQLGLRMMGEAMPGGIQWKTMDGSFVEMTPTVAAQVFAAAAASDVAIFTAAEAHKAAMEAAEDPAAYDFSGDWPAGFGE